MMIDRASWTGVRAGCCVGLVLLSLAMGAVRGETRRDPEATSRFTVARHGWFCEQVRECRTPDGMRMVLNAPARIAPERPTRLVVYAAPNGSTLAESLGCRPGPGISWRYDIQHVAAQVRRLREVDPHENVFLACVQADGKSWPAWRRDRADAGQCIRELVDTTLSQLPGTVKRVSLTGHSGGGAFLFSYITGGAAIPSVVDRIAFLDANYSYEANLHFARLRSWLEGNAGRRLVVLAYDDRKIVLDGKPVVGPTGGTFRASHRMLESFRKVGTVTEEKEGDLNRYVALGGGASWWVHTNPENQILHTTMVGEWNGLLHALTVGTPAVGAWGDFAPPRAYVRWVQPSAELPEGGSGVVIPQRCAGAAGGSVLLEKVAALPVKERERVLTAELLSGNVPEAGRRFVMVETTARDAGGNERRVRYAVMADYLALGGEENWVRVPLTPMAAQRVATAWDCMLPTRKIVDDLYRHAGLRLEPLPLTQDRESVKAFLEHHRRIEAQRGLREPGELVVGTKKDVVLSNRLLEKPNRVAIYGWHRTGGKPIQPLTIVHHSGYVDYSHGVRLVKQCVWVDGEHHRLEDLLRNPVLAPLVSDEGPLRIMEYPVEGP